MTPQPAPLNSSNPRPTPPGLHRAARAASALRAWARGTAWALASRVVDPVERFVTRPALARWVARLTAEVEGIETHDQLQALVRRGIPRTLRAWALEDPTGLAEWLAAVVPTGWHPALPVGRYEAAGEDDPDPAVCALAVMLLARRRTLLPAALLRSVFSDTPHRSPATGRRAMHYEGTAAWLTRPDATPQQLVRYVRGGLGDYRGMRVGLPIHLTGEPILSPHAGEIHAAMTPAMLDAWVGCLRAAGPARRGHASASWALRAVAAHPMATTGQVLELLGDAIRSADPSVAVGALIDHDWYEDADVFDGMMQLATIPGMETVVERMASLAPGRLRGRIVKGAVVPILGSEPPAERPALGAPQPASEAPRERLESRARLLSPVGAVRLVTLMSRQEQHGALDCDRVLTALRGGSLPADAAAWVAQLAALLGRTKPEDWMPMLMHGSPAGKDLAMAVLAELAAPTSMPDPTLRAASESDRGSPNGVGPHRRTSSGAPVESRRRF